MEAAKNGHIEIVAFLIESGANIHIASKVGTALVWAAYSGHTNIVILLYKHGADPYFVNVFGKTALTYAHENQDQSTMDFLHSVYFF